MSKEIELKLTLSAAEARRLLRHPLLLATPPVRRRLYNTYFDTSDFALRQRGVALRLRRRGQRDWVMTVKGGDSGPGGLAQRNEWEAPTQPGVFDFSPVDDRSLREFLEGIHKDLRPVFTTDFSRVAWLLDYAGSRIELVLDRGDVRAEDSSGKSFRSPLCEIELELLEGGATYALFDLAITLAHDYMLHPEIQSKAERGYVLAGGQVLRPVKGLVPKLSVEMAPIEAFRAIALSCLVQLQRNEAGVAIGQDPEFVHQARVAIRRLRCAFKFFSPVLAPEFVDVYSPRWREVARSLGGLRDWDVLIGETLQSFGGKFPHFDGLELLSTRSEDARVKAGIEALKVFKGRDYSRLMLAFCAALMREAPATIGRAKVPEKYRDLDLKNFARKRLRRIERAIGKVTMTADSLSAEQFHSLRIDFKRLRYAQDIFSPLFPRKRQLSYQSSLVALQDLLGSLNDHYTATRLLETLAPAETIPPILHGWIEGRIECLSGCLAQELKRFRGINPPWR